MRAMMARALPVLAALLAAAAAAPGAGADEARRFWRPQRQVRSLESADALGARLFTARQRRLLTRPRAAGRAPRASGVDPAAWLSRFGELRVEPRSAPPRR
jgi:hypothetical protein